MTNIIIAGARGRMGQALLGCAARQSQLNVVGQIDAGDDLAPLIAKTDVVIDFTSHESTTGLAQICAVNKKAMVIGTTGHQPGEEQKIRQIAAQIPLVWTSNYSTGVNVLFWLTRKATETLGPAFDVEIVEMHHRLKKDAPSGTAKTLAENVAAARQQKLAEAIRHGREGLPGQRTSSEIGMHSMRGGDVVGDHTVIFATPGERLELTHKASSRDTFANGALRAAEWVVGKAPGIYDMQDVLGLKGI